MTPSSVGDETTGGSSPPAEQVRDELKRVLGSPDFKTTSRRRKLLKYLVEELLAGRDNGFKGYTIATVVFGRDESFDPQTDPVVRLEARRLRHDLDSYYVSAGRNNPLRITVPKGQYTPVIEWAHGMAAPEADVVDIATAVNDCPENPKPSETTALWRRSIPAIVFGAAVALLAGFTWWGLPKNHDKGPGNGPALAVLPFTTYGTMPALGQGIADEVLTGLSRFPDIRLYFPRAAAETADDPIDEGAHLGLTYVVNGNIQSVPGSDTMRISARLMEVKTRRIIWIGNYERTYTAGSLLAVKDEIANSVASALGQPYGIIRTEESLGLQKTISPSATSYECVLRAYSYRRSLSSSEAYAPTLKCLEQAVERDPTYAEAWAMLGWLQMDAGRFGWTPDGNIIAAYQRGLATALHANDLDRNNISSLKALGSIYHYLGNFPESERVQRRALALNPNDPDTMAQLGWRLAVRGRFDEGIPLLRRAIERTVNPPGWYYHLIIVDEYLRGDYEEMLRTAKTSTVDGSGISWSFVAIAEGALMHKVEAEQALKKMAEINPLLGRDPSAVYRRAQATDTIVDALVEGLKKAGWKQPVETQIVP